MRHVALDEATVEVMNARHDQYAAAVRELGGPQRCRDSRRQIAAPQSTAAIIHGHVDFIDHVPR
jgi:hypothetical protein